ncbi:hypothetical protein PSEG_05569 [Pseudomonas sp. Nvir]
MNNFAQDPHFLQLFLSGEQFFFTGTGTVVIDSREDAFFGNLTREVQLHVTGAFKLFVDHFVHFGAGVNQRRGDDGQAAALFDVTCRTEETLRTVQGVGVHTTCQDFTRSRYHGVVGSRQTSNGVEQDDNVFLVFNQTFCFLDNHLGNLHVAGCRLVKGGSNHFTFHQTLHLGHFFRTFVDQQHHQHAVRVVVSDALRDVLQQHRFTGFRRRDNQTTLAAANRGGQIQYASG